MIILMICEVTYLEKNDDIIFHLKNFGLRMG